MTSARRDIVMMLLGAQKHVTADELYAKLQAAGSSVGRMTVFRTLDLLVEAGIVRPVYQGSGAAHFILLDEGKHHHLICYLCAKTVAFADCMWTPALNKQLEAKHNFRIEGHMLELYGYCSDCQ